MKLLTTALILSALTLFGACSSKATVSKPEPLRQIRDAEVRGQKLWSDGVANTRGLPGLRPLLAAERVFLGSPKGRVKALNDQGETLWQVDSKLRLSAGPALADGALIFGTLDGEALALNALDGSERWRASLTSEVISLPGGDSAIVVLRSGDGRVYGLSPQTGERQWTTDRNVPALTLRGSGSVLLGGRNVYLGMDNGRVLALDKRSGEPVWEEAVSLPAGRSEIERLVDVDADLLLIDDVLFVASYGGDLVALRADSGTALWRRDLASASGLDFDGQCLYVTDVDSVLWCLDPANGAALWEQNQLKHRRLTAPLAYKGNVVVADLEGYVHAVSAADGRIVGRARATGDAVVIPLQAADGRLYLMDRDGRLQTMDLVPIARNSES